MIIKTILILLSGRHRRMPISLSEQSFGPLLWLLSARPPKLGLAASDNRSSPLWGRSPSASSGQAFVKTGHPKNLLMFAPGTILQCHLIGSLGWIIAADERQPTAGIRDRELRRVSLPRPVSMNTRDNCLGNGPFGLRERDFLWIHLLSPFALFLLPPERPL